MSQVPRLFLDTDVLLDVLLAREPFATDASRLLQLIDQQEAIGYFSVLSVSNLFYLLRKAVGSEAAKAALIDLVGLLEVQGVTKEDVMQALTGDMKDIEDAMQHAAAGRVEGVDAIITRNVRDYRQGSIPAFTPSDYLKMR